jgi:UDP-N-acetylglucosamine 2-epimerase (non-hydrolysing)/UDP-GlcNAc3NAcA epimerase
MNVLTVVGNRPQFIKAAAVSAPLRRSHHEVLIHTGQHFDERLSGVFFDEFGLPSPDQHLGIARGSNSSQTARMLGALAPVVSEASPDAVLVYGDTNSTLAGALAGSQAQLPVAHVEAGMRSFDRAMPEELNRVLADHASALLLCSSEVAVSNLRQEGIVGEVELVGDVMVDVAMKVQPTARARLDLVRAHGVTPGDYFLATAHRPGNVDSPERLAQLVELLLAVPYQLVLPLHPRTHARLRTTGLLERLQRSERVVVTPPLGYLEVTALLCNARAVMTDSGGLQKEAYLAGTPCVTLRTTTEWIETVQTGWNALVDLDIRAALAALDRPPPAERPLLYGDGRAAERVVDALTLHFG